MSMWKKPKALLSFGLNPYGKNTHTALQRGNAKRCVNSLRRTATNSNRHGMTTSKISNKRSADPFDKLIFEKGLRIKNILVEKELDLIAVVLNNGFILKENISTYPLLKKASPAQLQKWRLIGGGIGVSWKALNEDLSLKRFIHQSALQETLRLLQAKPPVQKIIA